MHILNWQRLVVLPMAIYAISASGEAKKLSEPTTIDIQSFKVEDAKGSAANFKTDKLLVFIESGSSCPIMRRYAPTIGELIKTYGEKVQFYFVDSAAHDTRELASAEAEKFNFSAPVLMDTKQSLARALGFIMSTQAAVVNGKTKEILYRGAIDDSYSFDGRREPRHHYLKDALETSLAGRVPETRTARAYGCAITFK